MTLSHEALLARPTSVAFTNSTRRVSHLTGSSILLLLRKPDAQSSVWATFGEPLRYFAGRMRDCGPGNMSEISQRIESELQVVLGQPLSGCWRAADLQVFEFGPIKKSTNRRGEDVLGSELRLHVQCRWRLVDGVRIIFGRDDLFRPANETTPIQDFDWDKEDSVLDAVQRRWFDDHRDAPVKVVQVTGDAYGGCRIDLEDQLTLELFPCDSGRGEYSEHWRFLGHRSDGSHFVVTGYGIEGDHDPSMIEP